MIDMISMKFLFQLLLTDLVVFLVALMMAIGAPVFSKAEERWSTVVSGSFIFGFVLVLLITWSV